MKFKLIFTIIMIAVVTIICAQKPSQSMRNSYNSSFVNANNRGNDSLAIIDPFHIFKYKESHMKKRQLAKSASSFVAKLDSIIWGAQKRVFVYDDEGNITLEISSTSLWLVGWTPTHRFQSVYNAENLPVERIESYWNTDSWSFTKKYTYTYDDENNLIESALFEWNSDLQDFELDSKETYVYNASNSLIEQHKYYWNWNGPGWYHSSKVIFTLDGDDKILMGVGYSWQAAEENWRAQSATEYAYNGFGLEVERIVSSWSSSTDTLVPLIKWEKSYDNQNRLSTEEYFYSLGIADNWEEDNIKLYDYDSENNVSELVTEIWESGEYVPSQKLINTFDFNYLSSNIMEPLPDGWSNFWLADYNNKLLSTAILTNSDNEWIESAVIEYYYTDLGISTANDPSIQSILVYPNPSSGAIRFNGLEGPMHLTIFDLQGRLALQKQVSGMSEIHLNDLPSGIYVYTLDGLDSRVKGKLVKE